MNANKVNEVQMSLGILIKAFNEDDWNEYVNACKAAGKEAPAGFFQNINIPEDVKTALYSKLRDSSIEWLKTPAPLFDNNKPIDLLNSNSALKGLKEGLLRLPD